MGDESLVSAGLMKTAVEEHALPDEDVEVTTTQLD